MKNLEWRQAKQTVMSGQQPFVLTQQNCSGTSQQMMTFWVVEADILLLEPLQDQEFDGAVRWNADLKDVFKVCQVWGSRQGKFRTV
jgi:hypothetical protein